MPGIVTELLQQLYFSHVCNSGCNHNLITLSNDDEIDEILNSFAQALHNGELKGNRIHSGLYAETARKLTAAITKGTGEASFSFDDPNNALRAQLLTNVHAFSGAKSLTENAVFSELLLDENGVLKPFNQYLNDIQSLNKLYNKDFLAAEYNNAVAGSQTAVLWNQYKDDDWLKYSTAGDERVRASHAAMDGIVQQKSSTFWATYWPPNDWGCRCTAVPADKPGKPITSGEAAKLSPDLKPQFKFNTGSSGIIFKDDLPYFKSYKGIKQLDAMINYGLKPVEKILQNEKLSASLHLDTETDYYAWWQKMVTKHGVNDTDFVLKDKLGTQVLFDATPTAKNKSKYFKDHITKDEPRYTYAPNLVDIVTNADEVWNNLDGWFYLKYYKDGLYTVIADIGEDGIMKAQTMYKVDKTNYKKLRKGILLK